MLTKYRQNSLLRSFHKNEYDYSLAVMEPNVAAIPEPSAVRLRIRNTAIKDAIKPYSSAVTPLESARRRRAVERMRLVMAYSFNCRTVMYGSRMIDA